MKYISILLLLCFSLNIFPQKKQQERELLALNVGFGVLTTTIGALINKPKNKNAWDCIKQSAWQGALGGGLQFAGKKMTYELSRDQSLAYGWPSKLVHTAGSSICVSASRNYSFGKYWYLDYGPVHCDFFFDKGKVNVQPQLNILFAHDLSMGLYYGRLDWETTLKSGTFAFSTDRKLLNYVNHTAAGTSYSRSMLYPKRYEGNLYQVFSHEIIHTYQADAFRVTNTYFDPLKAKIKNKTVNTIFKYVNVEIPFSFALYGAFYSGDYYYSNPFEFEAKFISTNQYVDRNQYTGTKIGIGQ